MHGSWADLWTATGVALMTCDCQWIHAKTRHVFDESDDDSIGARCTFQYVFRRAAWNDAPANDSSCERPDTRHQTTGRTFRHSVAACSLSSVVLPGRRWTWSLRCTARLARRRCRHQDAWSACSHTARIHAVRSWTRPGWHGAMDGTSKYDRRAADAQAGWFTVAADDPIDTDVHDTDCRCRRVWRRVRRGEFHHDRE